MAEQKYLITCRRGTVRPEMKYVPDDKGGIVCYTRRVELDEFGQTTFVSEWQPLSRIWWPEYVKPPTLWERVKAWFK